MAKSKAKLKAERAARAEQRRTDLVLIMIAEDMLADGRLPDLPKQLLTRFIELAKLNAERLPPGRPRSDINIGMMIDLLIERGMPQAAARKKMATQYRKQMSPDPAKRAEAVRRAHNRYLAQQRERDKTQR
jgi:hypothetical protein